MPAQPPQKGLGTASFLYSASVLTEASREQVPATPSLQKFTSTPPPKCPADTVTVPGHLSEWLFTAPLTRISCHKAHPDSEPKGVSSSDKG